jgi:hypothetical protein
MQRQHSPHIGPSPTCHPELGVGLSFNFWPRYVYRVPVPQGIVPSARPQVGINIAPAEATSGVDAVMPIDRDSLAVDRILID